MKNKEFKFVFLPIALMVGALIFLFFYSDSENEKEIFKTAEKSSVTFAVEMIQEDFSDAVSDLEILSASQSFNNYSTTNQRFSADTITHLFGHYLESKRIYESITFLDRDGMEKVRVNYNGGAPTSMEEADLVSRAEVDYFKEAVSLHAGQTYMTFPMDATPETSPELRGDMSIFFLAPVYNASSGMVGVVMIEYRLSTLSRRLMKIFANSQDTIMIADVEGRWLLPPRSGRESLTTAKPLAQSIGDMFPDAWRKIRGSRSGQFHNDSGLFTYDDFHSPKAIHHHVMSGEESRGLKAWKIISLVPTNVVNAQSRKLSGRLVILYVIFIIFIGVTLKIQDRYSGSNGDLPLRIVSPIALMGITVFIVFMSEFIVMLALQAAPQLGPLTEASVDATLLSVMILPMISFLLIRPLTDHIRARQKNEEELKRSEENVKAIIKSVGEGIVVLDEEMKIQLVNEELLNIFGYAEAELIGEKITLLSQVDSPEGREGLTISDSGPFRSLLKATGRRVKITGRRKSGETFPMEARIEKTTTGDECFYVGALRDITDREFALKALAESEEKFRSSFENAAIGMVLTGLDGKFLQVNGAFCSMVGFSKMELMSKTFSDITCPEDLEEDLHNVNRALQGEIDSFQLEKRYIHKNGDTIWVLLNAALIRESGAEPRFFIAQIEDITERKKTELALIGAKEDAEESNLLKDKFVSLVAHDLCSPF
ncbi:MAG: PAS domain S-box protein, partial [Nitrospinota bacterium]|nr:PAS domain S-box protein [Nitrospinota bacterium]